MRKWLLFTFTLLVAAAAVSQEIKPPRNDFGWARAPYRLDFVIREMDDGKVVNSRNYSMIMTSTDERGRTMGDLRAGSRIPVNIGDKGIQYVDVGVNISSRLYVLESGALLLENSTEISTLATPEGQGANPIIRQIRSNTIGEVNVGKASQIALLDDPVSKRRFQIEVTATKLK
jgi:hypothetical protein